MKKLLTVLLIISVATSCSKKNDIESPVLENSKLVVFRIKSITVDEKVDRVSPERFVTVRF